MLFSPANTGSKQRTLNSQHTNDPTENRFYRGDFDNPGDIAFASDGSLYVADRLNYRILKIATDGTVSTVAGNGSYGSSGDEGLATQLPRHIALAPDGSLFVGDDTSGQIRKITPDGIIHGITGSGKGFKVMVDRLHNRVYPK